MEDTVTIYLRVNEERTKRNLLEHQENYNNKMRKLHGTKAGAYTLKGQQLNTAKEFIRLWSIQCRANSIYNLSPNRHFWVTTSLIAKRAGVSYTTVQRHVSRLLEAKVITQKTFHGTNCAPRYQLNPDRLKRKL
jgi:DNA-binding transcriptional ArsR family regulator